MKGKENRVEANRMRLTVVSSTPEPPEAKFTPISIWVTFVRERYGGGLLSKPNFFAINKEKEHSGLVIYNFLLYFFST